MEKPKPPIAITALSWLNAVLVIGYATMLLLALVFLNEFWFGAEIRSSFSLQMLSIYVGYILTFICAISFIKLKKHRLYFFIVGIFIIIELYFRFFFFSTDHTSLNSLIRQIIFFLPQIIVFIYFLRNFQKFYSNDDLSDKPKRKPVVYSQ